MSNLSNEGESNHQSYICGGAHCKCLEGRAGGCTNWHNGDHTCPSSNPTHPTQEPKSYGETHSACNSRLAKEGDKSRCCYCVPHDGCDFEEPKEARFEEQLEHFGSKAILLTQTGHSATAMDELRKLKLCHKAAITAAEDKAYRQGREYQQLIDDKNKAAEVREAEVALLERLKQQVFAADNKLGTLKVINAELAARRKSSDARE